VYRNGLRLKFRLQERGLERLRARPIERAGGAGPIWFLVVAMVAMVAPGGLEVNAIGKLMPLSHAAGLDPTSAAANPCLNIPLSPRLCMQENER
jgi:hypothetical protein